LGIIKRATDDDWENNVHKAHSMQKHCGEEYTELDGQPGASSMKSSSSSKKHMIYQDHG